MYADKETDSMKQAIEETARRRSIQEAYNQEHGIVPKTIIKEIRDLIAITKVAEDGDTYQTLADYEDMSSEDRETLILKLEKEMKDAAKALDFETAATLRDTILELKAGS